MMGIIRAKYLQDSQLQQSLKLASRELDLDTKIPFTLDLPCGRIEAEALVKNFGYECGVVINTNTREPEGLYKHLADFGYGAATLSKPTYDGEYDSTKWMLLCRRWGWRGKENPPHWY
ncbi:MAG TPA: hypothetical protein ENI80_01285 [Acidiferrobacteraceae bacterium]|nr:hypothetical protein [Acidiferrobacteraceae bacterium]